MGQENLPWDLVEGKTRADDPRFWPGGAQLSGETFENALIVDVDITAAELIGATFKNCTLARLDLRDGFMSEATFENCIFYKCDLRRADLTNATLKDVTIDRSNLCSAKFTGVQTENFRLMRSEVSPCDFRKSKLSGFFSFCDLSAVNFDGADIQNLELFRCNIKFSRVDAVKHECTTTGIEAAERAGDHQVPWFLASAKAFNVDDIGSGNLEGGYFFGKDLSGQSFKGRTLKNVNFLRCSLNRSDFTDVTFDNVWFWDCEVDQLSLNNAKADRLTMSFLIGTIEAKGAQFEVWNVYESELQGSNFEGCSIQAGTFSMTQFPDSNFSNIDMFVVESFMTDFTGCNFTGTDLSTQASERSYFDDGINSLPMSQSPLKHVAEAGDINFFYLPISNDPNSARPKTQEGSKEKAPFQPLKDATPFKDIEEPKEAKIPVAISPTPAAAPAASGGLNLSPVEESIATFEPTKLVEEPAKSQPAQEVKRSAKQSKPFDALEESSSPKVSEQLSRPTLDLSDAPHIQELRKEKAENKAKLDLKPEPAAKPEPAKKEVKPQPKTSLGSLGSSLHSSASSKISDAASKARPKGAEPSLSSPKLTGSGPAASKKPIPSPSLSSTLGGTTSSFGTPSTTGPISTGGSSLPKPGFGKSAGFGNAAHNSGPITTGSSAPGSAAPTPSTTPAPAASPAPTTTSAPLGGTAPSFGQPAAPGGFGNNAAPFGAPAQQQPQQPATQAPVEPAPAAPVVEPAVQPAPVEPAPVMQEAPAPAPQPAAQPTEAPVTADTTTPDQHEHTEMVHHEAPKSFFARIISWFKSLFGK